MKKKIVSAVLACAMVFSLSATAFAHHGAARCSTANCTRTGTHYHDGVCYTGARRGCHGYGRHH